jgi:uncharacterized protein YndB with AHSA1/START domain
MHRRRAISECEIDLRPGGLFRFVSRQPDGVENPTTCCYLEVVPYRRLVWTDALHAGYRPAPTGFFTAVMTLEPRRRDLCTTVAPRQRSQPEPSRRHGFHDGWGTVLDQLGIYADHVRPLDPLPFQRPASARRAAASEGDSEGE